MPTSRRRKGAKRRRLRRATIHLLANLTEGACDGDDSQRVMLDFGGRFAVAKVTGGDISVGDTWELSTRVDGRLESWSLKRVGITAAGLPLFRRISTRPATAQ